MKHNEIGLYLSDAFYKVSSMLYSSIITVYLVSCGLSMSEIGLIWSVILATTTICDYPTGTFADKFGRIRIFFIGMLVMGTSRLVLAFNGYSYAWIIFAAILSGFGESQITGTMIPWFIEAEQNSEKSFIRSIMGKKQIYSNLVGIITGLLIAGIDINYQIILIISGTIQIAGGFIILIFFKDNRSRESYREIAKGALKTYLHSRSLIIYTVLLCTMYSFYSVYLFVCQPIGTQYGLTDSRLGLIQSLYIAGMVISGYIAKKLKANSMSYGFILGIVCSICLSAIILIDSFPVYLASVLLFSVSYGSMMPFISSGMHSLIKKEFRSATTSLVSSVSSAGLVVIQIALGALIDAYSFTALIICLAVILAIYVVCMAEISGAQSKR